MRVPRPLVASVACAAASAVAVTLGPAVGADEPPAARARCARRRAAPVEKAQLILGVEFWRAAADTVCPRGPNKAFTGDPAFGVPANALCVTRPYQNSMFPRNSMRREPAVWLARPNPVEARPVVPCANVGWLKAFSISTWNLTRIPSVTDTAFESPMSM